MSHALLLRLFLSSSFFSVHVALQYLNHYADNIGITYYLTRRLREFNTRELRDVWGFVCHLLVTRNTKSRALEAFVVETAQRSTHIALLTLWFMQSALKDLAISRHDSQSFLICQRVLHQCHEIIFGDLPPLATAPYASLNIPFQARLLRKKVKPNAEPALVGIGMVLAGVPAMPSLTEIMGQVAIEQGRADQERASIRDIGGRNDDTAPQPAVHASNVDEPADADDDEPDSPATTTRVPQNGPRGLGLIMDDADRPKQLPHRKTVSAAQTTPALPLHLLADIKTSRFSEDPLGLADDELPSSPKAPYQSSPSISSRIVPSRNTAYSYGDSLLQKYDPFAQSHLLRGHFCRSEVQFILALENISNRLLVIPKPARVSALRAELTALNHKLPAEVCMPMWCSSSDTPRENNSSEPHHRIVRIPPGESVVLNSAERAPYLLLIEILHDDLDFDPSKRNNKDVLRKIVLKESERKGASKDLIPFNMPSSQSKTMTTEPNTGVEADVNDTSLPGPAFAASPVSSTSVPADEEEIDLVEQLYGAEHSLRSVPMDLSDSIVLRPAPKNKELDMVAWSRVGSQPTTPALSQGTPFAGGRPNLHISPSFSFGPSPAATPTMAAITPQGQTLTLDDYSERMRTAAVMLAQLNLNLVREPITSVTLPNGQPALPESSSGPLSWLPGSRWLLDHSTPSSPSQNGLSSPIDHPQPAPTRMRLQPSEAYAIRDRIMKEMIALEEERVERMRGDPQDIMPMDISGSLKSAEDESIIRRELNKADPSAVVFSESWAVKKSRIRHGSPYGHLANWDCVSVIVKTGGDLRQEQLAVQLIQQFERIWKEENCQCWVRYFRILITGGSSGLVETITDAVSIHSIKKAEYARRLAEGRFGHVTLLDHFKSTYGDPSSAKFARAQRNFAKSLAGYSVVTYLLQIKDRHNGNILLDRDGHLIHIDFGFMLSNSPGNIGFEAAPFKLPPEYVEILGGVTGAPFLEFRRLFREGFEASRKHCDELITLVELMQKDSTLPCFAAFGEQTAVQFRERFQPALTHSLVAEHVERLIDSSLGSNWTRLYDSYQYYSQSIL
ncbi:Phosphatidylinositol 4-kinase pik1alpha (PI4-kinase)(PtdIns-4-kinase) [Pleurotus pulmonarius]|nr:Phosphatidylinositol 4-kinase pik1alpha (PI4-kinase)(PtdIns-4-kinase) [Pleurotus pulmonarius]